MSSAGLPELSLADLQSVPLDSLAWVHLEGRSHTVLNPTFGKTVKKNTGLSVKNFPGEAPKVISLIT